MEIKTLRKQKRSQSRYEYTKKRQLMVQAIMFDVFFGCLLSLNERSLLMTRISGYVYIYVLSSQMYKCLNVKNIKTSKQEKGKKALEAT